MRIYRVEERTQVETGLMRSGMMVKMIEASRDGLGVWRLSEEYPQVEFWRHELLHQYASKCDADRALQ